MEFDSSNSTGVYDHSSNPDSVEAIIDACRLSCDWEGVLSGIKKYGQIFDAGAATSSYQHANIAAVRAYYWVCMGEALYELKGDYYNAIDCAKRAIAIDQSCVEARIIVTRVLLDNCGSALRIHRKKHRESNLIAGDMTVDLDARTVLSELLKTLTKMDQKVLIEAVYSFDRTVQNVLLSTIEALESKEVLAVCDQMLHAIEEMTVPKNALGKHFILLTANILLQRIDLSDIVAKYYSRCLSEYRYWLFLDAVATRMMVLHHLDLIKLATAEAVFILNTVLPSEDVARNSSFVSFSSIPEICRNIVLSTACRLPLFERRLGLLNESLESFHRCASGNSILKHYFPLPIQLGLNVEIALSMLQRARGRHEIAIAMASKNGHQGNNEREVGELVLDYHYASLEVQTDIDNAYSLLCVAQDLLSNKSDQEQSPMNSALGLAPLTNSLLNLLPRSAYEPEAYAASANSSTIGVLMASIIKLHDSTSSASGQTLEWAISLEIKPKPDLLYLLAGVCCDGSRWEHAIEFFEQCHFSLKLRSSQREKKEAGFSGPSSSLWEDSPTCVGELLTWLGAGRSPSILENRWLPLARAAEVCLISLANPLRARNYARRCLLECFEREGLAFLKMTGSDDATKLEKKKVFSVFTPEGVNRNTPGSLCGDLTVFQEELSDGERSLFFLLGKIHSAWSALYSTTDSGRIAHLTTTIKIYDTLLRSQSVRDRVFDSPHDDTGMGGAFSVITRSLGLSKEREEKDDIPMSMSEKDKDNVNSAELSVRYAVCLANLGETAMAVTYARKTLQNPETRSNSQMLHLLALLTSSAGDDKKVVGTAAALCKLASGLTPLGPSSVADYIRLKIDSNSSSSSSSNNNSYNPKGAEARKGVKMESGPSSRERNVRLEKEEKDERDERDKNSSRGHHYECEVEDIYLSYDTSEAVTTHTAPSISPQQPPYINNIASPNARLTLAMFEWVVCGGDPVLSSIDSIVTIALRDFRAIQDFQNEVKDHHVSALVQSKTQRRGSVGEKRSEIDDYSESAHRGENPFVVPSEAYARMDCPQSVRTIIEILVISSQIYRKAGQFEKATCCLEDGWRVLFSPHREAMYGVCDVLLQEEEGTGSEYRRIDLLRQIPTLTGWRLSEACGWGSNGYPDLEAEILCETAMQADNSHSARDLLMMSLSLCPDFVPSLLALANMELQASEGKAGHTVSVEDNDESSPYGKIGREKHNKKDKDVSVNRTEFSFSEVLGPSLCVDSQAYGFAMAAVRARELSPECWHALGRVYQAFGMSLEAAEAFSTALEYIKHSPIRPFSTVLADAFIKPADERKKGRI